MHAAPSAAAKAMPKDGVPVAGQKRERPQPSPQGVLVQADGSNISVSNKINDLNRPKRQKATSSQDAPKLQGPPPGPPPSKIPLTVDQQRAYVIEHRKISISQLRTHLAHAEAELKHLQKGGHYVNFRISAGPKLSVPNAAPKPRKKPKNKKGKDKERDRMRGPGNAFKKDIDTLEDIKVKSELDIMNIKEASQIKVTSMPGIVSAQQKALLKELEELQKRKKRLTAMIREFQKTGGRRMKKSPEPPRNKVHWDYLLDEMGWMSTDFNNERKWKSRLAKKIMRAVIGYHGRQQALPEREAKLEQIRRKKGAAAIARLIKKFWLNIGKLVQFKRNETLNQKKNVDLNRHLELLVDHTQSLTKLVAKDLVVGHSAGDEEFTIKAKDTQREREDKEALMQMEAEEQTSKEEQQKEVIELQEENKLTIEQLKMKYSYKESSLPTTQNASEGGEEDEEEDEDEDEDEEKRAMLDASEKAAAHQPTGFDLGTVQVKTKLPSLLRHGTLREYQHIGLDWLVTMCDNKLNGILADEMGLGKTIQTIAMLAHLACDRGIWGQHLVVVPTSVMVNWEIEFKRWLPGFKILCYHGGKNERKKKRKGWSNPNTFHVCITSYQLILKDAAVFKRKRWHYLILDEAQNIKNFRTKRWQVLLTFRTERRLLLTGTPLQNNVMELWSLMHFLMPSVFQSQKEFQDWFSDPVKNMVEGKESMNQRVIASLHKVLRPFILRRLKKDVAKQMPKKFEHVVHCRLAKRQRILYEEFMANSATRNTLASKNFLGLMNVLMQLRKVCNHPDIFAGRPIISPFDQMDPLTYGIPALAAKALLLPPLSTVDIRSLGLETSIIGPPEYCNSEINRLQTPSAEFGKLQAVDQSKLEAPTFSNSLLQPSGKGKFMEHWLARRAKQLEYRNLRLHRHGHQNQVRCSNPQGRIGIDTLEAVSIQSPIYQVHLLCKNPKLYWEWSSKLKHLIKLPKDRALEYADIIDHFTCVIPKARAPSIKLVSCGSQSTTLRRAEENLQRMKSWASPRLDIFYRSYARMKVHFPDKRLIQWDCGKLQMLSQLLKKLKSGGHRVLLFTQMTRMLDILEHFLNIYGYNYLRLDGTTKPEERQRLMERFNNNEKIFVFILSTRSGGVGVNLTGADTVIFYDTDWNPAMDLQAQDRCHRIGQTREVHIYRLVTRNTIEENILKKSNQKRQMNNMVIGDGEFNTQFFSKMDPRELLGMNIEEDDVKEKLTRKDIEKAMAAVEDHTDQVAARRLDKETAAQSEEFAETGAAVSKGPLTSHSFESALSPVQRYALRFVEDFDPTNNLRIPLAIATPASVRMKETFAGSSKERKAKSNDIESKIFYPATDGISDYRAHVAFVQKLGFVYDSKIFTPLQFPSNKSFREDQGPTNWGVFSKEDSIKKMLPSTKDRKNKGVLKSFIADSKRKRRLNELDTPPITVRVPLSMLRKFKRKLSRKIGDASDRSKENRLPRKAYYKIKKLRRMYTEGLFPPKMDRVQPSVSPLALKGRPPKPDEATSSDHIPWTQDEENLVQRAHIDFGPNWDLIADILNSNPRVGGRLRTPAACMYHHHLLSVRGHKTDDDLRKESQKRKKKEIPRKKIREGKDLKPRPKSEYVMATPKQPCGNLYPLIDKSMKSINAQRRLSLENDESGSKSIVKSAHASHKKAITESHTRLGLPQLAIGKTLMPHQIIQLRDRCNQQEKAGGRIGATVHSRQQFNSKHSKSSKSHSSASQRKQLAAAQQRRLHQHPSQNSGVGANGKTSQTSKLRQGYNSLLQDKSRTGTTMSRLMPNQSLSFQSQLQANQMKQLPGHKVGSHLQRAQTGKSQLHQISLIQGNPSRSAQMGQPGSLINIGKGTGASSSSKLKGSMSASGRNIGPVGMSNMTTAQLVKYVLSTMPSLKQDVVRILQRKDWSEKQKIDRIANLFQESAQQNKTINASSKKKS
mmetsp:Transcript_13824/g.33751  ORF Transcript_13824/g.33751 Transcript_13824/m.33751 type:complete len:1940 (-) Transcript_13824:255-6074(-)|eukprot:CAMPEP_0114508180 /NCGR_PEP_ID=MMETSP0109-20121206/12448_1 /TAXON_ID=29199 /ORGANISM="Chlorarachnion reptans, Strain CCCM449" /LENGTH=1939 /DNA_ID=CAMNT_0001687067 /DNA_START=160 /DNA_END=5979 /DNA_ORIENTATION=+